MANEIITSTANGVIKTPAGISNTNVNALQNQYDKLRASGLSQADATANIKNQLQNTEVPGGQNAFDVLKNEYNTGKNTTSTQGINTVNTTTPAGTIGTYTNTSTNTGTPGVSNAPGVTNNPYGIDTSSYDKQINDAYNEYSKSIAMTPEQAQEQQDLTNQLKSQPTSFADLYQQMQNQSGVQSLQNQLNEYNKQLTEQNQGLKQTQEQIFTSSGGVTDAGVAQLRAYNSKDFIRNIADLTTAANNTSNQINAINSNIDKIMALRQQDLTNQRQNIMDRLDLLKNRISPEELDLLKTKLDQKVKSISDQEQYAVDIAKMKTQDLLTNGDINSEDEYIRDKGIETAINTMFKQFPIDMVQTPQEKIQRVKDMIAQGMTPQEALTVIKNEIVNNPKWKAYEEAQQAKNIKTPEIQKVGDNIYQYNPKTNTWDLAIKGESQKDYTFKEVKNSDGTTSTIAVNTQNPNDYVIINGTGNGTGLDFSKNTELINANPNVAAFKNNNPTGLTWGISPQLKKLFDENGIKYSIGTARPSAEGGNYIKFSTVEDGLKAYQLSLMHPGGASNVDIYNRLYNWSAGGDKNTPESTKIANKKKYAENLMKIAGITKGTTFEQLNQDQLNKLTQAHLQKESPGFLNAINKYSGQTSGKISTEAQRAIDTKTITGTQAQKEKVLNELSNLGEFKKGQGNQNFYIADDKKKSEIPNFITAFDRFEEAKKIIEKHKNKGDLDEMLGSWDAYEERKKNNTLNSWFRDVDFGKDFATLDQIFGKELSQYMNQISGATVGDKEVERLKRQVPNLDMSETEFEQAFNSYAESLKNSQNYMLKNYGFNNIDSLKNTLGIGGNKSYGTTNTTKNPNDVNAIYNELFK